MEVRSLGPPTSVALPARTHSCPATHDHMWRGPSPRTSIPSRVTGTARGGAPSPGQDATARTGSHHSIDRQSRRCSGRTAYPSVRLAWALDQRFESLRVDPSGWLAVAVALDDDTVAPPGQAQPVLGERVVATYILRGRAIQSAVTERLLTALEDITGYTARAYVLRTCERGRRGSLDQGAVELRGRRVQGGSGWSGGRVPRSSVTGRSS